MTLQEACKAPDGFSNQFFNGVLAIVMGIVTMVRLTKNMPKKLTDGTLYSSPVYYVDSAMQSKGGHRLPETTISTSEYMTMLKRMAELEEKVSAMCMKQSAMPPEKEEMLNTAISRVEALEQELSSTKKVIANFISQLKTLVPFTTRIWLESRGVSFSHMVLNFDSMSAS